MQDTQITSGTSKAVWTGRVISGLVVVFLLVASALPKLIGHVSASQAWDTLGYPQSVNLPIGVLELVCALLYAIPRTSVLGAILLTGLLGGATATHVRVGDPWFLFPVVLGLLAWTALYLREERLKALLPLRRQDG